MAMGLLASLPDDPPDERLIVAPVPEIDLQVFDLGLTNDAGLSQLVTVFADLLVGGQLVELIVGEKVPQFLIDIDLKSGFRDLLRPFVALV